MSIEREYFRSEQLKMIFADRIFHIQVQLELNNSKAR